VTATGTLGGNVTSYVTGASYLPFGPLASLTWGNGLVETRTFDARYQPATIELRAGAATLAHYGYAHDPAGNVTAMTDVGDPGYSRAFGYDDLGRLVTANSGEALWGAGGYVYDATGNLDSTMLGASGRMFTYKGATPFLGRVVEVDGDWSTPMSYDEAGNDTSGPLPVSVAGVWHRRRYSPRNLLTEREVETAYCPPLPPPGSLGKGSEPWPGGTTLTKSTTTVSYDARGVRVVQRTSGGLETEHHYFHTPELQPLNLVAPNGRTADVIWFGGRPIADADALTVRMTFTDHLGTPLLQTEWSGQVVWRAEYEPYGEVWTMRAGDPADQPLRFPGQMVTWTGWPGEESYNIFRWYRSGWGRYTQADPIGFRGGINLFGYVDQNPVRFVDPKGLAPCISDPLLANCGPDSGCCTARCIDELRVIKCRADDQAPAFSVAGMLSGAALGAGVAFRYRAPIPWGFAACVIGGGAAGGLGLPVLSAPMPTSDVTAAWAYETLRSCMRNCGQTCGEDQRCLVEDLFSQTWTR
jgi:RHS repeat-associated protein